jgi:hypothetical protein
MLMIAKVVSTSKVLKYAWFRVEVFTWGFLNPAALHQRLPWLGIEVDDGWPHYLPKMGERCSRQEDITAIRKSSETRKIEGVLERRARRHKP